MESLPPEDPLDRPAHPRSAVRRRATARHPNAGMPVMTPKPAADSVLASNGLPVLLTTEEVAKVLQVNRSTLSRWRARGVGPRVVWLSPGAPRYRREDVSAWLSRVAG